MLQPQQHYTAAWPNSQTPTKPTHNKQTTIPTTLPISHTHWTTNQHKPHPQWDPTHHLNPYTRPQLSAYKTHTHLPPNTTPTHSPHPPPYPSLNRRTPPSGVPQSLCRPPQKHPLAQPITTLPLADTPNRSGTHHPHPQTSNYQIQPTTLFNQHKQSPQWTTPTHHQI